MDDLAVFFDKSTVVKIDAAARVARDHSHTITNLQRLRTAVRQKKNAVLLRSPREFGTRKSFHNPRALPVRQLVRAEGLAPSIDHRAIRGRTTHDGTLVTES